MRVRNGFRGILVGWVVAALLGVAQPAAADVGVYADGLATGWQDWSWGGVTRSFAQASPVHAGSAAIGVTYTGGWSGLQLGNPSAVDVSAYDSLRFWVHGGTGSNKALIFFTQNADSGGNSNPCSSDDSSTRPASVRAAA